MDFDSIIKWFTETLPAMLSRWFDAAVEFIKPVWGKNVEVVSAWFEISVAFFKQAWENLPALMADWGAAIGAFLKSLRTELSAVLPQSVMQAIDPVPDWALFIVLPLIILVLLILFLRKIFSGSKKEDKHLKSVESPEVPTLGDPLPPEGETVDHTDADDLQTDVPDIPDPARQERVVPLSTTREFSDLEARRPPPDEPGERQEIGPAELQTRLRKQLGIDPSQDDPVADDQTAAPEKTEDKLDDDKSDDLVGGQAGQDVSESLNRIREFRRENENRSASLNITGNITGRGDETDVSAPKVASPPFEQSPHERSVDETARAGSNNDEGRSEPRMDVPSSEPTLPEIEEILTEPHFGNAGKTHRSDLRQPEPLDPADDENVIRMGTVDSETEQTNTSESDPPVSIQMPSAVESEFGEGIVGPDPAETDKEDDVQLGSVPEREEVSSAPDANVPAPAGPLLATLARLEEDLRVNERLAIQNPASAQTQRDVAVSMSRLADALVEAGDLSSAITRFEQSLAISERLAEQNPASAEALRDVAVSLNRLGDALIMKGDIEQAGAQYEIGLKISQRLAEQSPANAQAQRDVWISLNRMGDLRAKAGDVAGAIAHFETGLQISQRLADFNPANVEAQRDLIVSCAKLGEISPGQGWWTRSLSICERLAAENRLNPQDSWMLEDLRRRSGSDFAV